MVLIERPARTELDTGPAASFVSASFVQNLPPRDSFDNIDKLFDEPMKIVTRPKSEGRWRVAGDQAAATPRRTRKAAGIAAVAAEGDIAPQIARPESTTNAPTREPIQSPTNNPVEVPEELARLSFRQRLANVSPFYRSVAIWGGGITLGVGLTLGIAGYLLSDSPTVGLTENLPQPESSRDTSGVSPAAVVVPDTAPAEVNDAAVREAHLTTTQTQDLPTDPSATMPSDIDGIATADSSNVTTELSQTPDVPPPPSPVEVPQTPPPAEPTALASTGDELADLARWLQNPIVPQTSDETNTPGSVEQPGSGNDNVPTETTAADEHLTPVVPTRPPADRIDAKARLREPVAGLQFKQVPLSQALRTFTALTTIPTQLDADVLGRRNIRASMPVDMTLRDERAAGVLQQLLKTVGMDYRVAEGFVEICNGGDKAAEPIVRKHSIADFSEADRARLREWVTQLIEPGSWETGDELPAADSEDDVPAPIGRCQVDDTMLVVEHREVIHYRIIELCERIRVARGSGTRSQILADRAELGSRYARFAAFDRPVTARLTRDKTLDTILALLETQARVSILVDWPAVLQAGWSPRDTMTIFCDETPLRQALHQLLDDKGLGIHVIDSQTLEITSAAALMERLELEVYPLGERDVSLPELEQLSREIMQRVGVGRFQPAGRSAIGYDPVSRSLLVSLSQPEQRQAVEVIEAWKASR
ncbi:MAG: hypothetical protein KDA92_06625 [Planctomycetales bacterium]|nr:hypothetical protein [Planctomycetales bacterium]